MEVPQGSRYIEEGAKANDDIDGPVIPIIDVTPQGNVNTSKEEYIQLHITQRTDLEIQVVKLKELYMLLIKPLPI